MNDKNNDNDDEETQKELKINTNSKLYEHEFLVYTLFGWIAKTRAVNTCISPPDDKSLELWSAGNHNRGTHNEEKGPQEERPALKSPTKSHPQVHLTGLNDTNKGDPTSNLLPRFNFSDDQLPQNPERTENVTPDTPNPFQQEEEQRGRDNEKTSTTTTRSGLTFLIRRKGL